MTRPCWLRRAVRNRHRHAVEQASRHLISTQVVTSRLAENLGALPGAGIAILLFALGHINPLALGKETLLL